MKSKNILHISGLIFSLTLLLVVIGIIKDCNKLNKIKTQLEAEPPLRKGALLDKLPLRPTNMRSAKLEYKAINYNKVFSYKPAGAPPTIKLSADRITISKKGILQDIACDINKAFAATKLLPYYDVDSKEFAGFKVDGMPEGRLVKSTGLQNGDIIKIINDQKLNSPQRAIQIFRKARNQPQIDIGLLRKRQLIKIIYKIKD